MVAAPSLDQRSQQPTELMIIDSVSESLLHDSSPRELSRAPHRVNAQEKYDAEQRLWLKYPLAVRASVRLISGTCMSRCTVHKGVHKTDRSNHAVRSKREGIVGPRGQPSRSPLIPINGLCGVGAGPVENKQTNKALGHQERLLQPVLSPN